MRRPVLGAALAAGAMLGALALGVGTARGSPALADGEPAGPSVSLRPALAPVFEPAPVHHASDRVAGSFLIAKVEAPELTLRARPGSGAEIASVRSTTDFGSPATLAVVERRDGWLGVTAPELPNGRLGWVRARGDGLAVSTIHLSVHVDLSERRLIVESGSRVVRRIEVGVGRPGSPTPVGRYAITDKLDGAAYGSVYGCCVLALSAHQPNLPAGWRGGNRVAIHGTPDPASIGVAASAGCLHASDDDLRYLMRRLPLGTPVFIRE